MTESEKDGVASFPGRCCPGLIEGFIMLRVCHNDGMVFRGVVAPASLKAALLMLLLRLPHGFPGRCCPGLIEGMLPYSVSITAV